MDVCWLQPPYIWGDCVDNLQLCLIQDLGNVLNRLRANKLTLNMTKTKFMLMGSRQTLSTLGVSLTITIYDSQASQFTTAKSLGVTIDNKLNWGSHIDKLTKKVPSGIGAIKRIWHLVSQATLLLINQALIEPHFDYCKIVLYRSRHPFSRPHPYQLEECNWWSSFFFQSKWGLSPCHFPVTMLSQLHDSVGISWKIKCPRTLPPARRHGEIEKSPKTWVPLWHLWKGGWFFHFPVRRTNTKTKNWRRDRHFAAARTYC